VYYAAAIAIVEGAAGEKQFSDALVRDPEIVALRDGVTAVVEPSIGEAEVKIAIALKDGRRLEKTVEKVIGSVENPMSDAALEAKFLDLTAGVLPSPQARKLLDLCWNVEQLADASEIARTAAGV